MEICKNMNRIKVVTGGKKHLRSLAMRSMSRMWEQKEELHLQNYFYPVNN